MRESIYLQRLHERIKPNKSYNVGTRTDQQKKEVVDTLVPWLLIERKYKEIFIIKYDFKLSFHNTRFNKLS